MLEGRSDGKIAWRLRHYIALLTLTIISTATHLLVSDPALCMQEGVLHYAIAAGRFVCYDCWLAVEQNGVSVILCMQHGVACRRHTLSTKRYPPMCGGQTQVGT